MRRGDPVAQGRDPGQRLLAAHALPDEVAADDSIQVVSGSGALGFYPWIDRVHGTYGIVAVDDELHGPEHAVPASQRIARMLWQAAA